MPGASARWRSAGSLPLWPRLEPHSNAALRGLAVCKIIKRELLRKGLKVGLLHERGLIGPVPRPWSLAKSGDSLWQSRSVFGRQPPLPPAAARLPCSHLGPQSPRQEVGSSPSQAGLQVGALSQAQGWSPARARPRSTRDVSPAHPCPSPHRHISWHAWSARQPLTAMAASVFQGKIRRPPSYRRAGGSAGRPAAEHRSGEQGPRRTPGVLAPTMPAPRVPGTSVACPHPFLIWFSCGPFVADVRIPVSQLRKPSQRLSHLPEFTWREG